MNQNELRGVDWDFRGISIDDSEDASAYEHLRSHPHSCEEARRFLEEILNCEEDEAMPLRDHLIRNGMVGMGVFEAIWFNPPLIPEIARRLVVNYPWFPKPFLQTPMKPISARNPVLPFEVFEELGAAPADAWCFIIDRNASKSEVLQAMGHWLKCKGILKDKRGMRKSRYIAELKALSAYRLADAGYSFEKAKPLIERAKAENRIQDEGYLPMYDSVSSWSHAVERARAAIYRMGLL